MKRLNLRWPALAILSMILAVTALTAPYASAQGTDSGTVTGNVKDATGALIPGATIVLTNVDTKEKFQTVTNKDGAYVLTGVKPATYSITAQKTGFNTDQILSQAVQVGTQTTANFALAVGAESTVVEVVATNADLQTLNSTIGDTVTQAQINAMPTIQRDVSSFATLQPGVSPGGNVAGTSQDQAVMMLDGGQNSNDIDGSGVSYATTLGSDTTGGKVAGSVPSGVMPTPQDSVEQFKVATSGQTADFNNSSGAQIQIVTKRGTNQWRGTAYEYYLDSTWSGNNWQWSNTLAPKTIYHYSRFGFSAGGQIAPYALGGKTYIFGNYEGYRFPQVSNYERVVPTPAFISGQVTFGGLLGGSAGTTYTPSQFAAADPRRLGVSPTLQQYWTKYEPQYGTTYAGGMFDNSSNGCGTLSNSITCDGINERGYISKIKVPQTSNFFVLRMDHDFGQKEHFYVSYRYFNLVNLTANQVDIGGYFAGDQLGQATATAPRPQTPWYLVSSLTTNISSTFTSTFHGSYLRNFWQWGTNGSPAPAGTGVGAALEPGGESATAALAPITIATQSIRTRFWDGHDYFIGEDLTKLKGNHLIQFGGQYQRNFNYHQRSDNGSGTNFYPVYQLGETGSAGNINLTGFAASGINTTTAANARLIAMNTGMITDNQIAYTRSGTNLTLNAPLTPAYDQSTIRYYNAYVSDTWHARPSLTINAGLGYAIEMPPVEANGKIITAVDGAGNQIAAQQYLATKAAAATLGQSYNPQLGFALLANTANGGTKYPYKPFYGAISPRISLAWNPKVENKFMKPIFGESSTVIRGGYGRVYARLNGVGLVLNTLLAPGLIQGVDCTSLLTSGVCGASTTDTTNFRVGPDGLAPPPPVASATLPQPYYPGFQGPSAQIPQALDPTLRPSAVDSFNLTIQRQLSRKTLIEVGYIGRILSHEYEGLNLNDVPYMLSVGGQTFASAYVAIEQAFGCTTNISTCLANTAQAGKGNLPTVAPQPFFENALGGSTSAYCAKYANCTAAVVAKEYPRLGTQKVFEVFQNLDNGPFNYPGYSRHLASSAIPGQANGAQGQVVGGAELTTATGYGNYNGVFATAKLTDFHGLTVNGTLTYSKALGLNDAAQSSSGLIPNDSYDLKKSYGIQSFQQKFVGSIYGAYNTPWFKKQEGIVGRLLGGYNIAPIFAFGSGTPKSCSDNGSQNEAFGGGNVQFASGDNEQCVFTQPHIYSEIMNRGIPGGNDPIYAALAPPTSVTVNGVTTTTPAVLGVGTGTIGKAPSAQVNTFSNPVAIFDQARPPILGLDEKLGGTGIIPGDRYWNMDLQVRKSLRVFERADIEFSAISTNVFNHLVFSNPGLNLASSTSWGVSTSQGNSPRNIQLGIRASY